MKIFWGRIRCDEEGSNREFLRRVKVGLKKLPCSCGVSFSGNNFDFVPVSLSPYSNKHSIKEIFVGGRPVFVGGGRLFSKSLAGCLAMEPNPTGVACDP